MHRVNLPQDVVERIIKRRGKLHILDSVDASRSAFLVIDMQNHFVAAGMPSQVASAADIVPNINRLAAAIRAAGGTVVWIRNVYSEQNLQDWSVFFRGFYTAELRDRVIASLAGDSRGSRLWHELAVVDGDWHMEKDRFSAFIQGASDLEARLREAGIDTVVITGTLTPVCCEATARDAMMRNFHVVVVSDATAAHSDADHNASLAAILQVCGDVMTVDEVVARIIPAKDSEDEKK